MRITANQVTFFRLVMMPPLAVMLYTGTETTLIVAGVLGTLIGCTDFVDGYLARKHGPTVLGGLMDPIADKVFIAVGFLPYADLGWVPWWLVLALFLREFLVTAMRSSFELRQKPLRSSYVAKVKTWVQMVGLGLILYALIIHSRVVMMSILVFFCAAPLIGWAIARARGRRWTGALVGAAGFALCVLCYGLWGAHGLTIALFVAIVGITWASGLDYLALGARELLRSRDFHAFDAVRLAGALALPVLAVLALVYARAPAWALITLVAVELAVGGLDNLLAHHGAAARPLEWGARTLGAAALLGAALALPARADLFAVAAAAVSVAGTAVAFVRGRRYYLDAGLRDEKRAVAAAAAGAR